MKKVILAAISVVLAVVLVIFFFNYFSLSKPLSQVIKSDARNTGITMRAHFGSYVVPSILVLDIRNVSGEKSAADVFRLFLQYANRVKDKKFDTIELASKGTKKFVLKGEYFKQLGMEYNNQNPIYTMRTFPENVYTPDGNRAFESWTGGLLDVVGKQMEEFTEFQKEWYIEDMKK